MSERFDAFFLPRGDELPLRTLRAGDLECRYPEPTAELVRDVARRAIAAGATLARRPVAELMRVIDAVAARLADARDPLRLEAERLLPLATGYSPPMIRLGLDRMSADWRADALETLVAAELGSAAVLDGFAAGPAGRATRAYGPRLAFHVFAGNVPGVAVTSLIRSLLVKAPSLAKTASGEPVLPVLFARALAELEPELADALAVTYWPGGSAAPEAAALEAADVVVAYGSEETTAGLRARAPAGTTVLEHGPRFSVGVVGREALKDADLPDRIARAVAAFDQQGCVSPHAVWVEGSEADALAFAAEVAAGLERLEAELPRGSLSTGEASAIHQERGAAELRGHQGGVRVFASAGTAWTVMYDPDPAFRPSCLNRFLHVHPVADLADVPPRLAHVRRYLQSVAIEGAGPRLERLASDFARAGATRVTTFDRLPWPPPHWHHDGRGPLRELLRFVDLETDPTA